MILITHDMGVVAEIADDVVVMYAGQIVEQALRLSSSSRPEHPYTEALLGALPTLDAKGGRRRPPDRRSPAGPRICSTPPAACRFAPRCPFAALRRLLLARCRRSCARSDAGHWVRSAHPASERDEVRRHERSRCSSFPGSESISRSSKACSLSGPSIRVRAVDGVDFDDRPWPDARPRGRVGIR